MEYVDKEVYYFTYCVKCKYANTKENEDPCWDCLTQGVNEYSHKPVNFVEKEKK